MFLDKKLICKEDTQMQWQVVLSKQAKKQSLKLPEMVQSLVDALMRDLELNGPIRYNWKNFGKIKGQDNHYHCHIKKGKPTYVAYWVVLNKKIQFMEITYVGTHENAPY
jgi:mRNA-degrading endonuclease RelE of RelBE toxin-antitoxin system